jgi:predicted ABC-type ATPase
MVAGPNGSGKSTLLDFLQGKRIPLGYCLNPDQIERELVQFGRLDFSTWGLNVDEQALRLHVAGHGLAREGGHEITSVRENILTVTPGPKWGYFAAILCDFMRLQWVAAGETFTFETVMSSPDKVRLLEAARAKGYRTYLYFVCTDSFVINRERVASRVLKGGHDVPEEKIESRYRRSLKLLPEAIDHSSRAYLFDNSGKTHRLIGEYEAGKLVAVSEELPGWFVDTGLLERDINKQG